MNEIKNTLIFAACILAFSAVAEDVSSPRPYGQYDIMMCQLDFKAAADYDIVSQCISKGKDEAKAKYAAILNKLKRPAAIDALKNYHVAVISGFDGVMAGIGERRFEYDRRQKSLEDRINEAWIRFELEQ